MHRFIPGSMALSSLLICANASFAAPPQTATLAVENMTCGTCPIVVKKALERVPGVTSTSVDFDKKTATVTFDPDKATSAKLTQATTGSSATAVTVSPAHVSNQTPFLSCMIVVNCH
jgi:periplasmic mercuric ion binding protein